MMVLMMHSMTRPEHVDTSPNAVEFEHKRATHECRARYHDFFARMARITRHRPLPLVTRIWMAL